MPIYGDCGADYILNTTRLSYVDVPKSCARRLPGESCNACMRRLIYVGHRAPLPYARRPRLFALHSSRALEPELETEAGQIRASAPFLPTVVSRGYWSPGEIYNSRNYRELGIRPIYQHKNKDDWCARLFETSRTLSADKVKQKAADILDGHCAGHELDWSEPSFRGEGISNQVIYIEHIKTPCETRSLALGWPIRHGTRMLTPIPPTADR